MSRFVYTGGDLTVTDYTPGQDTIELASDYISKSVLTNSSKDVKFTVGVGSITVKDGAGKAISIKDGRGSFTASGMSITLGSDFGGTMSVAGYLSTVKSINGQNSTKALTINGNANANDIFGGTGSDKLYGKAGADRLFGGAGIDYLYGEAENDKLYGNAGNDKLYGGDGNDLLYGQAGSDTLTGGAGKDTFVYYTGYGNETITDYTAGEDTVQLSSGYISKSVLTNSDKDVKFTIGDGSITVKDGAGKAISIKDGRGSFTASGTTITLGSDFGGTMSAAGYLSTVKNVYAQSATKALTINGNGNANDIFGGSGSDKLHGGAGSDRLFGGTGADYLYGEAGNDKLYGNAGNDKLYGGDGNDLLYGQEGSDTLTGGAGSDTFMYYTGYGNETIADYTAGEDTIQLSSGYISKSVLTNSSKDVKFTIGDGSITVKDGAGKAISIKDGRGSFTASGTTITLGSDFSGTMSAAGYLDTVRNIYGQNATKALTINGNGNNSTIIGGKGNDTINVPGGNKSTITGGTGNDTITVTAGTSLNISGDAGIDIIRIKGGTDHVINGGTGNDKLYIDGGTAISVDNSGGSDYIEIGKNVGNSFKVESGASTDVGYNLNANEIVKVFGGNNHDIRLYGGDDKIIIAGGQNHIAYTDGPVGSGDAGGSDTIVIQSGGHVSKIVGGNGDDVIAIANGAGDGSTIYTGLEAPNASSAGIGNNIVNLLGGSGHTIYLGGSQNTVMVEAQDVMLNKLYGTTDNITIRWSEEGMGKFRINCPSGTADEQSILRIEGVNSLDFKFETGTVNVQTGNAAAGYASQSLIMRFSGMYFRNTGGYSGNGTYQVNDSANTRVPVYVNDNGFAQYTWCAGNQQISYTSTAVAASDMEKEAVIEIARWGTFKAFGGIWFDDGFKSFAEINMVANSSSHEFPRFG